MVKGRLFWKFFFIFLLAQMTFFYAGMFCVSKLSHSRENEEASLRAGFMLSTAKTLLSANDTVTLGALLQVWNSDPEGPFLQVLDNHGLALPGSLPASARARSLHEVQAGDGLTYTVASSVPATTSLRPPPFFVPLISGALVSTIFSFFLAWYLARPVTHLRQAFTDIGQGRLQTRISHHIGSRRDEIADLGQEFDKMADQLQQLISAQQRLLHDMSHELRSPLARLQVAIGLLRQQPEEQQIALERIENEVERLNSMVQEVLTLARMEAGADAPPREQLDIIELLSAIADDAAFEAQARNRRVAFSANGRFVLDVNGDLIYRAIENVVRNAVKFTAEGTTVEVDAQLSNNGKALIIAVRDHGPGVPVDMLETIFEPFRQVEGQSKSGYGLGLAIARRAIESHGGRICAEQPSDGGLTVKIFL